MKQRICAEEKETVAQNILQDAQDKFGRIQTREVL
jgi:hypothetical protein